MATATAPRLDELMTLTETSRAKGVTVETVREWIIAGKLKCVWFGGRRLVFREDVEKIAKRS